MKEQDLFQEPDVNSTLAEITERLSEGSAPVTEQELAVIAGSSTTLVKSNNAAKTFWADLQAISKDWHSALGIDDGGWICKPKQPLFLLHEGEIIGLHSIERIGQERNVQVLSRLCSAALAYREASHSVDITEARIELERPHKKLRPVGIMPRAADTIFPALGDIRVTEAEGLLLGDTLVGDVMPVAGEPMHRHGDSVKLNSARRAKALAPITSDFADMVVGDQTIRVQVERDRATWTVGERNFDARIADTAYAERLGKLALALESPVRLDEIHILEMLAKGWSSAKNRAQWKRVPELTNRVAEAMSLLRSAEIRTPAWANLFTADTVKYGSKTTPAVYLLGRPDWLRDIRDPDEQGVAMRLTGVPGWLLIDRNRNGDRYLTPLDFRLISTAERIVMSSQPVKANSFVPCLVSPLNREWLTLKKTDFCKFAKIELPEGITNTNYLNRKIDRSLARLIDYTTGGSMGSDTGARQTTTVEFRKPTLPNSGRYVSFRAGSAFVEVVNRRERNAEQGTRMRLCEYIDRIQS